MSNPFQEYRLAIFCLLALSGITSNTGPVLSVMQCNKAAITTGVIASVVALAYGEGRLIEQRQEHERELQSLRSKQKERDERLLDMVAGLSAPEAESIVDLTVASALHERIQAKVLLAQLCALVGQMLQAEEPPKSSELVGKIEELGRRVDQQRMALEHERAELEKAAEELKKQRPFELTRRYEESCARLAELLNDMYHAYVEEQRRLLQKGGGQRFSFGAQLQLTWQCAGVYQLLHESQNHKPAQFSANDRARSYGNTARWEKGLAQIVAGYLGVQEDRLCEITFDGLIRQFRGAHIPTPGSLLQPDALLVANHLPALVAISPSSGIETSWGTDCSTSSSDC